MTSKIPAGWPALVGLACGLTLMSWGIIAAESRPSQSPAASTAAVTFNKDVAPIVFAHCSGCHRPGEIGPFSLLNYRDVRQRATLVADVTGRRLMPPWKPAGPRGVFHGDRSLTPEQIALFRRWVDEGAPEGRAEDLPAVPEFASTDGWQLGTPDLIVNMPAAFELAAAGADVFRTFVLPIELSSPRFVEAIEFQPGNARAVHHATLGVDRTEASRRRDERDPEPGYAGGMIPDASHPPGHLLGWTPGQTPRKSPEPWRLEPGSYFNVQLHLQPTGKPENVRSRIGFFFTDRAPARTPVVLRLGSQTLEIPPGDASYAVTDHYTLPVDVEVVAIQGHAHNLARRVEAGAVLPDRTARPLLTIPDWDFRWQDIYRYAAPIALPRGTVISTRFIYDNSAANPRNPHRPPATILWGQNTSDEMGDLWLQVIPANDQEAARLTEDIGRKMRAESLAAFTKLVERDPSNAERREELALLYLGDGRVREAADHLRESLRLKPNSAPGHYNLGLALMLDRQYEAAAVEFRQALSLDTNLGEAHINLGVIAVAAGKLDEALDHFELATRLRPDSAEARGNLGRVLAMQNRHREAAVHLERAIELRPDMTSALTALAWIRATASEPDLRNPAQATRLAERAVALTGRRDAAALDALAAAYAADGRFEQASATARAAAEVATAAGSSALAAQIRERLARYERGLVR